MTRIITGRAGGRRLQVPKGDRTRPTTDRTREALFNGVVSWFGLVDRAASEQLAGIAVLDLFSGSGAVAIEAASRGAETVVAVESSRTAAGLIIRNASELGMAIKVEQKRVAVFLGGANQHFDLVFADPPYDMSNQEIEEYLAELATGWLSPGGLAVVERSSRDQPFSWPPQFDQTWHRRYGETKLYFATVQLMEE